MKAGDFIGFQPNTGELHVIENRTDFEVRILVVAAQSQNDQVSYEMNEVHGRAKLAIC